MGFKLNDEGGDKIIFRSGTIIKKEKIVNFKIDKTNIESNNLFKIKVKDNP